MRDPQMPDVEIVEVPCPLCGSLDARSVREEVDTYFGKPVSVGIATCGGCGMRFTSPRISEVNKVYEARESVDPDYVRFHTEVKGPVFRRALKRLGNVKPPPGRLLDVGSGVGGFASVARSAGYDVVGVEPSAADARYAREHLGINVVSTAFESAPLPAGSADVVTMWDVIEHVEDPRGFVKRAREILRDGGWLAMRFPGSAFHRLKALSAALRGRPRAPVHAPVMHLNFFSPATIRRLLVEEGFDDVRVGLTIPEIHSGRRLVDLARRTWHVCAVALRALTGSHLDNLEVYARKGPATA